MDRAQREVRQARDKRNARDDVDYPQHQPADHHYYAGAPTSRTIPLTGYRAQSPAASVVSVVPENELTAQNALYAPELPHEEHDVHDDIKEAAIDNPTQEMVSRALEHVQSKEIGTEYFHDTLVDNDESSYHYQQAMHVKHVAGSRNAHNGLFSWNGIGGIFGSGGALGGPEGRQPVRSRASVRPDGSLDWNGQDHLDTEKVLQAGENNGDAFDAHDLAEQVLRVAVPDAKIRADTFLDYDPAHPKPKVDDDSYVHSWAAYTRQGSRERIAAAKGQERFTEWQRTHKKQAWLAMHGIPCFNGKVPCKRPPPGHEGSAANGGGGGGGGGGQAAK